MQPLPSAYVPDGVTGPDAGSGAQPSTCYHCGEVVPPGRDFSLVLGGEARAMCCPGCRAVAMMIADSGLERFYDRRTAFNRRPDDDPSIDPERFAIYDDDALLAQFADRDEDGPCRLRLLIGGVSCAACTWLIETTLQREAGVRSATLNLTQNRLDICLDRATTPVSQIFERLHALGYTAQPWQSSAQQDQAQREFKRDLRRLAVAGIGMMQVGMFGIALHAGDIQGISADYQQLLRFVSFLVTAFVVFFSARGFFDAAWRHLRHGVLVMDLPVALAIGLAFAASTLATFGGGGEVYFDSVVMFTFLLLLARFVEKRLRYRDALTWQDAERALPDAVRVRRDGAWTLVPRRELRRGDQVLARAGDTIAIDARVATGSSAVREDSFNGEAIPRPVTIGDHVYAGTVNVSDTLELDATGTYADTRLAALQASIDAARNDKPALARLADRVASVFIGGVLLATSLSFAVWWQIDSARAFWIAIAVLVVSCPCALSLATPATLANAAAVLRRKGVIVRGENALESLAQVSHVVFDKTGTLTTGDFELASTVTLVEAACDTDTLLRIAAALQTHSNHPLASAFTAIPPAPGLDDVATRVGAGLEGRLDGKRYRIGSREFCAEIAPSLPPAPQGSLYWIALCAEDTPLAWLGLRDELRPEARALLERLRETGLVLELLSGDASPRARELGFELAFDEVHTGCSPQEKMARVAALQESGAVVLMVGDGLNDAPVLRQADVSVAVPGATDLARSQADFIIVDGNLEQIGSLRRVATRTRTIVLQNFAWAISYNLLGIPLAAMGWIPPWMAAIGMSLSSLLVVGNAARLRYLPTP